MSMVKPMAEGAAGLALDPFAFHGHPQSCIGGLGGTTPPPEPSYAFHTPYVAVARGHAHFTIAFDQLKARQGTLWLRVHMLPTTVGAVASLVTGQRVQLNWLAHHGGTLQLRFEAFRGATYAVMAVIADQTDATAAGLTITLDRPASAADLVENANTEGEARATMYGSDSIKPVALLLSVAPPTFDRPVSQPYTAEQTHSRTFRNWSKMLGEWPGERSEQWQLAYVLQVLDLYGMLRPEARGLLLGGGSAPIGGVLSAARTTCRTVMLDSSASETSAYDRIDPATLPGDLSAFDFVLSIRATDALGTSSAATRFVEAAMECLRPGGLAVHVVGHHPRPEAVPGMTFDRQDLERLALGLISRGHDVAQLRPALRPLRRGLDPDDVVPFGIIARRAASIL